MEEKADGTGAGARSILYKLQLKAPLSHFQLSNFSSETELVCICILTYLLFKSSDQLLGISWKNLAQKHIVLEKIQFLL